MHSPTFFSAALAALAAVALAGCGGAGYRSSLNAAEVRLAQARELGAEADAPFEYYFAREHLEHAQGAATGGDGDSRAEAEAAELYAQRAIDTVEARRGAGRNGTSK